MERGSYSKGQKEGKFYIKTIKPKTPIENIIYNTLNSDNNIIYKYVKDLEKLNIKCAKVIEVSDKTLVEEYINGLTVDQYINSKTTEEEKIKTIKNILDLFNSSLSNSDIRIDWNLNNFIIKDQEIVLVDYIPTLYVAALKKLKKTKEVYDLYYLYMNTDIQLSGIIGYSILPFIEYDKVHLKKIYNDIFSYANNIEKIDRNKKHIFIDKILLLDIYLNSNMKKEEFLYRYKSLSLSNKMRNSI